MNEDANQNVVLRIIAKTGYQLDPTQPYSGTLFKIALKQVRIDEVRRQQSERRRNEAYERINAEKRYAPVCDDPVHNAKLHEETARLLTAVSTLPRRQCHIIRECDLSGVSIRDYATKLGETESTIRSQRFRALKSLQKQLI